MERRIPLFPLDAVLLPAMTRPLYIFKPRYETMVRRCLDETIAFAVVLASGKALAALGYTPDILRKVRDYSDGRLANVTEGPCAFPAWIGFSKKRSTSSMRLRGWMGARRRA